MFKRFMQCVALCLFAAAAQADPLLEEGFDDPILDGWAIVDQSTPGGATSWFLGNAGIFPAQSGAPDSYAAANFEGAPFGGTIDNWLMTSVIDLSSSRTQLSFFTMANGAFPDRLEIWGSTSGASTDVGDFSLLLSINPALGFDYPTSWTEFSLLFGGGAGLEGRFAFRYSIDDTSINGDYIGIDTVRVATVPEPATLALLAFALFALTWLRRKSAAVR